MMGNELDKQLLKDVRAAVLKKKDMSRLSDESLRQEIESALEAQLNGSFMYPEERRALVNQLCKTLPRELMINDIHRYINDNLRLGDLDDEALEAEVEQIVEQFMRGKIYSIDERLEISNQVYSSFRGLGILDSILADETITEVMINGYENIFVERSGKLVKLDKQFESEYRLETVIRNIVGKARREVSAGDPIQDAVLADGSRVNVVLPPIALCGPTVTIRKFSKDPMTIEKLIGYGSLPEEVARKLEMLVRAKYNIFVSGGTGSGKTTFLNALSNFIPKDERIITIEDAPELQLKGIQNLVRMETRPKTKSSDAEEIGMQKLIKTSLRMRPDRIVVGEVRGAEALDMLQAMNTGHDGSLSTGHANSAEDMISRLETMVLQGVSLPLAAIRQQIASAVDIIIHLARMRDRSRKVVSIHEVERYEYGTDGGRVILRPLYKFQENKELSDRTVVGELVRTPLEMVHTEKLENASIELIF